MFAKLYDSEKYGQILVKMQFNEEDQCPELKIYAETTEGGVSTIGLGFDNTDEGWASAENVFEQADIEFCETAVEPLFEATECTDNKTVH